MTEVLVTPGMKHAQVRLHFADPNVPHEETIEALNGAKHYLRNKFRERLTLFRIPELHFEADVEPAVSGRMDRFEARPAGDARATLTLSIPSDQDPFFFCPA